MRQLEDAVRHHEEESMTLLGLRQRSENIDCQGFDWSCCWEYSKGVSSFSELHAVLRTDRIVADLFVYICGHLRPIIRFAGVSGHTSLFGVSSHCLVMGEVEHTGSQRIRKYDLENFGVSRMLSSQEAVVAFEKVLVEVL